MTPGNRLIRVLIAGGSRAAIELLSRLIERSPDMLLSGCAFTARDTVDKALALRPDLIVIDASLPNGHGVLATREIMAMAPTPIAVITYEPAGESAFQALSAGAVDVLPRPERLQLEAEPESGRVFIQGLREVARIGALGLHCHRLSDTPVQRCKQNHERVRSELGELTGVEAGAARIIGIGASTGGPPCIRGILAQLDPRKAPPVLIVQHMGTPCVEGFAAWLNDAVELEVQVARAGEELRGGVAYVAPDNQHLAIDETRRLVLSATPPLHGHRPAIDVMFESLALHADRSAIGVLLTGMGSDGARGLLAMRRKGATTIAQDEASSLVYGMPKAAAEMGAAVLIANALHIGSMLRKPAALATRAQAHG
jgi:chemotaxis response regulator CheB